MVSFEATKSTLSETVDTLDVLIDEVIMEFGEDSLRANGVDPAGVAMVDLRLSEDAFESYGGEEERCGVNLVRFGDIISMAEQNGVLSLSEADTGRVTVDTSGLEYTMALISTDAVRDGQDIPELEWDAELTVDADAIKRGVSACDMVSDHLAFEVDDGSFLITASGDTDDVKFDTSEEDDIDVDFDGDAENCEAIFSLDYVKNMVKAFPKDTPISLSFGDELPVVISFPIADGEGEVTYAVAPRIQS